MKYTTKDTHISQIRAGDTVMHNGLMHTVGISDMKYDSFMGWSLFGDCYRLGYAPVKKVIFDTPKIPLTLNKELNHVHA